MVEKIAPRRRATIAAMDGPSSLGEALLDACARSSGRAALVHEGRMTTFGELRDAAASLAGELRARGVRRGDRIVCSVSNRPEHLVQLAATWWSGAIHVCAEFRLTARELAHIIRVTEARALVYEPPPDAEDPDAVPRALRREHPRLEVLIVGDRVPLTTTPVEPVTSAPEDPAIVFVTSGTTGAPKATIGYHGNLARRWRGLGPWLGFRPGDRHLAQMPLSHGFGLLSAMAGLLANGTVVLVDRFSPAGVLDVIERDRVTVIGGAPAHFRLILGRLGEESRDVGSLRLGIGTAAAFPPPLVREIQMRLGVKLVVLYGSSEGVGVGTTDQDDVARGSVGRPAPESVEIVGPDRTPLPVGDVGEIAFSRAVFPVRYWGDDRPGGAWYYSGDLGRLDEEGRLYVYGRLNHQIDRGGLKVDPSEVEAVLVRTAGVVDAAVLGLADPVVGERVCACVVPADGVAPTLADVRRLLANDLAPHKLPEDLRVVDEIPRTPIGKVDLSTLRAAIEKAPAESIRTSAA
jgi:acyl-CoA synthetase (AMP-forming)/AMP-acid ligase II